MAGRRPATETPVIECLLIAQAVWEHGYDWIKVSNVLGGHPLVKRSACSAQWCESTYDRLMAEANLEKSEASQKIHAPINHKLAEKFYRLRLEELRSLVLAEEAKFKAIVAQIDAIQNGISSPSRSPEVTLQEEATTSASPSVSQPTPSEVETNGPTTGYETTKQATPQQPETEQQTPEVEQEEEEEEEHAQPEKGASPSEAQVEEQESPESLGDQADAQGEEEEEEEESQSPPVEIRAEQPSSDASPEGTSPEAQPPSVQEESVANESSKGSQPEENTDDDALTSPEAQKDEDVHMHDSEAQQEEASSPIPSTPAPTTSTRKQGKRKSLPDGSSGSPRDRKRVREGSETAEDEPGKTQSKRRDTGKKRGKIPFDAFQILHSGIAQHRSANIFEAPIRESDAPDYGAIVKRPMDLKTLKARSKEGVISSGEEYYRDLLLMFANALMYNRPDSDVYKMAHEMMHDSMEKYTNHKNVQESLAKAGKATSDGE